MKLFLIADIFGRTQAFETLCKELSLAVPDIRLIDPYMGIDHGFETEANAYDYFMDHVGVEQYQAILMDQLTPIDPDRVLVGFSVGASAVWTICGRSPVRQVKKAFCFYGSQIRHHCSITPSFDVELIFPKLEPQFEVDELIGMLRKKNRVICSKAQGLHGFMNKLSPNFDSDCYSVWMTYLKTSLTQLKSKNRFVRQRQ